MDKIDEILQRGVENIYPNREALEKALRSGVKITLYQGFDPSMSSLHLGNLVGVMKLRQFQKLGARVIFLIGDFTGMIGDPTDKTAVRKQLTREEVTDNSNKWKDEIKNLLDFGGDNPVEVKRNSEWNDKVTFKDLIKITSNFTVQQLIERDMFQVRLKENKPIYLHEFLYPVAQGYDSVVMDVDAEIGGSDQTFNMLAGRTLMRAMGGKEKYVLTTKLLLDKEGKKVGKTSGNALFLSSGPNEFYGGIMSFPDEVIELAFELLTEVDLAGIDKIIMKDPMNEKKRLAFEIVKLIWGESEAKQAQVVFESTFQRGNIDFNQNVTIKKDLLETLSQIGKSKSDIKRLVSQNAIDINGNIAKSPQEKVNIGDKIKVGERIFLKVVG